MSDDSTAASGHTCSNRVKFEEALRAAERQMGPIPGLGDPFGDEEGKQ